MATKTTEITKVTRSMMFDAVRSRMSEERPAGNSFAARGALMKWERANALLRRLNNGIAPSTNEVVAYFGKGARFVEGD